MVAVLLLCFFYFLLSLIAFFFLGTIIFKFFGGKTNGFYSNLFDKTATGLITAVFLFSLIASSLQTVQWGLLLIALLTYYEFKISKQKDQGKANMSISGSTNWSLKSLLSVLLLAGLAYAWFAYPTFNWSGNFSYAMPHKDKVYYSNIATALTEFGNENRQGAYVPGSTDSLTEPYHYFDLWLAALLSFFTLKPTIVTMSLLCMPICALISMLGVLSIFERRNSLRSWHFFMAFLLLFVRGIYLEIHDPDIAWAENFSEGILEFKSEKLGVLYIFAMISFRLLLSGRISEGLTSLLFLPIISIGNLPGVVGGILVFVLVVLLMKQMKLLIALRIVFYSAAVLFFIYIFYHYTSDARTNSYLQKGLWVFTDINEVTFRSLKIAAAELFVRVINNPWRAMLIHLPFLIIAVLALKGNKLMPYAFLLIGSISLVSLCVYGFFYKLVDAPQFYTNNLPLVNVFLILVGALFLNSTSYSKKFVKLVGLVLTGILLIMMVHTLTVYQDSRSFTEIYSDKYLCELDSVHKTTSEKTKIAVLYDPSQKPDLYNCDMSGPNLYYQPYFPKFSVPVDLNVFSRTEMPWGGEMGEVQKRFIDKAPFKQFVLRQMSLEHYSDMGESQVEYLRKENIRYVFVSPAVIPDHRIIARVKKRIKDERSGEQLLILNDWH